MSYREGINRIGDEAKWTTKRILKIVIPLVIIIIVISTVGYFVMQPVNIAKKTMDADNVIFNYEWFYDRYHGVLAVDRKIENTNKSLTLFISVAGDRSKWTFEDKTEHARLNAVLLGQKNIREDFVAQYNANAQKFNRKIFKSNKLPDRLE